MEYTQKSGIACGKTVFGKEDFMDMLKRIRILAAQKGVSVAQVEKECGFSKNSIIKWDKNMPSGDKILRRKLGLSYGKRICGGIRISGNVFQLFAQRKGA